MKIALVFLLVLAAFGQNVHPEGVISFKDEDLKITAKIAWSDIKVVCGADSAGTVVVIQFPDMRPDEKRICSIASITDDGKIAWGWMEPAIKGVDESKHVDMLTLELVVRSIEALVKRVETLEKKLAVKK